MTDNTEALPPLPEGIDLTSAERYALEVWRHESMRIALAQRQQVLAHAETAALLGINAALHRIEAGRPEDAKAPLEAARAALTAAPSAQRQHVPERNDKSECTWSFVSSRMCQRGSIGCSVDHALTAAPSAQAEPVAEVITWHKNGEQHAELFNWLDALEALPDGSHKLYAAPPAAQAEPQEPLPEFECAHQYATKRRLAVTREWIRGWDDCTDYIEGLLKARGIGKQEGK